MREGEGPVQRDVIMLLADGPMTAAEFTEAFGHIIGNTLTSLVRLRFIERRERGLYVLTNKGASRVRAEWDGWLRAVS